MKILQLNKWYPPHRGGIETVVQDIAEGLQRYSNVQVDVLVCSQGRQNGENIKRGVKVFVAGSLGTLLSTPISLKFFTIFRRLAPKYDLILLHHPFPLGLLAYWLFGRSKPVMVWYHSDIVRQRWTKWLIVPFLRSVLSRARKIFVSNEALKAHSPFLRPHEDKCIVLPFGIKMPTAPSADGGHDGKKSKQIRQQFGVPLILSVGRLVYYKGFPYLIEAMRSVDASALIIGAGPLIGQLNGLISQWGLEQRVHIISPVEDLNPYYDAADIFVFPSIAASETFGIVQLEAMAHELPIINTALPSGAATVSLDGYTGITVPPTDSRALAVAINRLIGDPETCRRFGAAGRSRGEKEFSYDRFVQQLRDELF